MPSGHGLTTRADQARCQCCMPNSRSGVGSAAIRPARIASQIGGYTRSLPGWCGHILLPTDQPLCASTQEVGQVAPSARQASCGRVLGV